MSFDREEKENIYRVVQFLTIGCFLTINFETKEAIAWSWTPILTASDDYTGGFLWEK